MTSVFTSDDIATLVANFQPVSLFKGRPPVVRSQSGDSLVDFEKVLSRFEDLLEKGQTRIEKAKLASLLGVQDGTEKICLGYLRNELIYESKNGEQLIPLPEATGIFEELRKRAGEKCVDLVSFAPKRDINLDSLRKLIQDNGWEDYREFSDLFRTVICTNEVADGIKTKLRDAIGSSGTEICDLPAAVSNEVPLLALRKLSNEVAAEIGGEIRLEGDHVAYVPANYATAVEARLKQIRDERITELAGQLEEHGYCVIEPETMDESQGAFEDEEDIADLVARKHGKNHPHDMNVHIVTISDSARKTTKASQTKTATKLLVTPTALDQELNAMRSAVSCHCASVWRTGERSMSASAIIKGLTPDDFSTARKSELARLLFRSDYVKELEIAVRKQLEDLEKEEHEKLAQLVEVRLIIPLQLYAAGIAAVKDTTLKQHLEDFIADHFRREVIPQMIQAAQEQKLLREKSREKEIEKFKQAAGETSTFATLQNAVTKLSKKLKLDTPSDEMVQKVRLRTLQAAAKSMQRMTRGSDVLQNLIWILLAQQSEGMFMSSGKDTSRMIKQLEVIGSPETAATLAEWRDALKAGQETKDDLLKMRDMAKSAVEAMVGPERKSSVSSSMSPKRRKSSATSASRSPEGRRKSSASTAAPPAEWQP